jgi:HAE1 family hydrophobic/amphiphilic exporter-1
MYINLYSKDPNDGSKIFIQLYWYKHPSELKRVDGVGDADIVGNRIMLCAFGWSPIVC